MRKNIEEVIQAFLLRKPKSGSSCSTDGIEILSYALTIARWNPDGTVWVRPVGGSMTTRGQIRACAYALKDLMTCQVHEDCLQSHELARACKLSQKDGRDNG